MGDAKDLAERMRIERDSLRTELDKLHDQIRAFKEENSTKYEVYHK